MQILLVFILVAFVSAGCRWSSWSASGPCTKNCEGGKFNVTRSCSCSHDSCGPVRDSWKLTGSCNNFPCCSLSDWSSWGSCSLSCGPGTMTRKKDCVCLSPGDSPDGKSYEKKDNGKKDRRSVFGDSYDGCKNGLVDTGNCNLGSCCSWVYGNWSDCSSDCNGVRRKTATCVCENPLGSPVSDVKGDNPDDKKKKSRSIYGDSPDGSKISTVQQTCLDAQPADIVESCGTICCSYSEWSQWSSCDKFSSGKRYRRQLCTCPDASCTLGNYNESRCVGTPEVQVEDCNIKNCQWVFSNSFSPCTDCCNGFKWDRQVCSCDDNFVDDSLCDYLGVAPLKLRLTCNSSSTCGCSYKVNTSCSLLPVATAQSERICTFRYDYPRCFCGTTPSDPSKCTTPPQITLPEYPTTTSIIIPSALCRLTGETGITSTTCSFYNFLVSGMNVNDQCITYEMDIFSTTGSYQFGANTYSCSDNCYLSWNEWSPCCGACGSGNRYRIQSTNPGTVCFHTPPLIQKESCEKTNLTENGSCCTLTTWSQWSSCSSLIGTGRRWRKYLCSCQDEKKCPDFITEEESCTGITPSCDWTTVDNKCNVTCEIGNLKTLPTCNCSHCSFSSCYGVPDITISDKVCTLPACAEECVWNEVWGPCVGDCTQSLPKPCDKSDKKKSKRFILDDKDQPVAQITAGTKTLNRTCLCGGKESDPSKCSPAKNLVEVASCVLDCPDCIWTNWGDWGRCSVSCGGGKKYRKRECSCPFSDSSDHNKTKRDSFDSKYSKYSTQCSGYYYDTQDCNTDPCVEAANTEEWKATTQWPQNTETNTFKCSSLSWKNLLSVNDPSIWEKLAIQYITAYLNIRAGVSPSSSLSGKMNDAKILLDICPNDWKVNDYKEASSLINILKEFNSGNEKFVVTNTATDKNIYEEEKDISTSSKNSEKSGVDVILVAILVPAVLVALLVIVAVVLLARRWKERNEEFVKT